MRIVTYLVQSAACLFAIVLFPAASTCLGQGSSPPGRVWTHRDHGAGWIPQRVSLGNHGTQVFTHYYLNNTAAALLSVHDGDPPIPVWEVYCHPEQPVAVDSAKTTDIHVVITETDTGNPNEREVKVYMFTSQYGASWVYIYPHLTCGRSHLQLSNDGQTIVATIRNPVTGDNEILVFSPASYKPKIIHSLTGNTMWGFDLSADGTRAVCGIDYEAHIMDVETGGVLFVLKYPHNLNNVGLALSGDGTVFATGGGPGRIRIYEWIGSTYTKTFSDTTPGNGLVRRIAVSDDSSTVAYGIGYPSPSTKVQVKAVDVGSKTVTMEEEVSSYGKYHNTVYDVGISGDGRNFAVALWGDEPDLVEEVRVYEKQQNVPVEVLNLPGSAYSVDISLDGKWVAAGSKAVHANVPGKGGQVDLIHLGGLDIDLSSVPHIGSTVTLELYGTPDSAAWILFSLGLDPTPTYFPGLGTFYLDLGSLVILGTTILGPQGKGSWSMILPYNASLIGKSCYFQGLIATPGYLTESWAKMTVLP